MNSPVKAVKYIKPMIDNQSNPPFTLCSPFNTKERFNQAKIGVETKEAIIAKRSIVATSLINIVMTIIPESAVKVVHKLNSRTDEP